MRRRRGVRGERFRVADVDETREELQRILERRATRAAALHAEGEDAGPAPGKIPLRQRVIGMLGQPRIVHTRDARVPLERLCDLERVVGDPFEPQRERFDALKDLKRVER